MPRPNRSEEFRRIPQGGICASFDMCRCRAFDRAPHVPVTGSPKVSTFNEKLQVGLLFLHGIIVLRVTDVFSKYSLPMPVRPKNPQEVRDSFASLWVGVFGPPKCVQMDEGDA